MGWLSQLVAPMRAATPENPSFNLNSPAAWDALGATKSASGISVTRDTALTFPAFWRGVNLIANAVAKVPLFVYEREGEGKIRATDHPAYQLLRYQPLPGRVETSSFDQKRTKMGHVLTSGNGYEYIARNGAGVPLELWLLDPDVTYPVRVNGQLWYVTKVGGEDTKLPCEDVLHWRGLGFDGLCGYDVLTVAADALGEGIAKQRYSGKFFSNNARPGVVIEVPHKLQEAAAKNLLEGWNRMHAGIDNAHRTAVLDQGAKVNAFTIDAQSAQLIESRRLSLIDVSNILNLPPHKLGSEISTGFASVEQQDQDWLDDCLDPWLCMIEGESREKLLSEDQKKSDTHTVEFLRQALVRADLKSRALYYRTALAGRGWMTPNEVRGLEDLNPDDGEDSDKILTPLNMGEGGADNQPENPNDPQPGPDEKDMGDAAPVFEDAASRVIKRIGLHAERAAKDGGKYLEWLEAFQADHLVIVAQMLDAPSQLLVNAPTSTSVAASLLSQIHARYSAMADLPAKTLLTNVRNCTIEMQAELAPAFARQMTGEDP